MTRFAIYLDRAHVEALREEARRRAHVERKDGLTWASLVRSLVEQHLGRAADYADRPHEEFSCR